MKIFHSFVLCAISGLSLMACAQTASPPVPAEKTIEQIVPALKCEKITNSKAEQNNSNAKGVISMIDIDNPPRGLAIPAAELKKQILSLIASLQKREDTNLENIEKHMAVKMHVDPEWDLNRVYWGQTTEDWKYWFSVTKLREEPASVINFYFFHGEKPLDDALPKTCTLDFETFANQLVALGYERGERPFRRRWGFGKDSAKHKAGFGIGVKVYRVDKGTPDGADCVESIRIGSGVLE